MPASCASAGVGYWQPTHFRSLVSTGSGCGRSPAWINASRFAGSPESSRVFSGASTETRPSALSRPYVSSGDGLDSSSSGASRAHGMLIPLPARFARWIAYAPRRPIARLTSSSSGRASAPPLTSTCHPGCTSMQVSTSNLAYCSIRGSVKLRSPDGRVERSLQTAARPKPGRPESAVASAGSSANGCVCGGEDARAVLRDGDGVLEVGGEGAVGARDRPLVLVEHDVGPSRGDHGLDREGHAFGEERAAARIAVVRDLRLLVHAASDTVPDEASNDRKALLFGHFLDRVRDVREADSDAALLDPGSERGLAAFEQPIGLDR